MFEYSAKITNVVDGDTFDAEVDLGFKIVFRERFRLARVNTPETYGVKKDSEEYQAGLAATQRVKELVATYPEVVIQTEKNNKGKYGRYIAEVLFLSDAEGEINLSDYLVQEGLAEYVTY
jgi:micrococcal nuclease